MIDNVTFIVVTNNQSDLSVDLETSAAHGRFYFIGTRINDMDV